MLLQDIMEAYTNNGARMQVLSAINFALGYALFIYSLLLTIREKKTPFPIWVYTFWVAHDFTGAVVFHQAAQEHGGFWFFSSTSIALLVWNFLELTNIGFAIKHARQDIWGKYYASPVSVGQAVYRVVVQLVLMFAIVNLFRVFMDDQVMFKWFVFSNLPLVIGPAYLWYERKSREGSSIGLAILIVLIMVNAALPPGYGMFTTASAYFDQPWFYIAYAVFIAYGIRNLLMLLKYPPKQPINGKKAIW